MDMDNLQEFHSPLPSPSYTPTSTSISSLHRLDTGPKEWEIAERRVHEILSVIQPTVMSEHKRKEIIEYIQIMVGSAYGIKVFVVGSVPLKTYLRYGDIDLTAMCHLGEEVLSSVFCCLLQNEEIRNTRIQVRNVQCVPAQVKVVKCTVEGIGLNITFNQVHGLCALSFLEQVDQLIGKDHLFKRSVILIKAWCLYESRILGAHCGLLSPYALETMVVHIINLFHFSLRSPLAVLYKFLVYYSKFDWENHCVAINGLVLISSLPEVVVQTPNEADEMLFSAEFLQKCRESYSLSTGINPTGGHPFQLKFLNVVDPLRNNNNIGRSVNKASFIRLKAALAYATEKLNCILALPLEEISVGIKTFFKVILFWNGRGKGRDACPVPDHGHGMLNDYGKLVNNEDLLAGIQHGLWSQDFGIFQGCKNRHFPVLWEKWKRLDLAPYKLEKLFLVNENFAILYEDGEVTSVPNFGEISKSRGTGTYIPQVDHDERTPFGQSWRAYSPRYCQRFVPVEYLCCENRTREVFPEFFRYWPRPYLAAWEDTYNYSVNSIEFETTQMLPPYSAFPPMDESPPAEEKNELLENEVKLEAVEMASPPVFGGTDEFPDLSGLRLGDPSEFPPLLATPHASGCK